VNSLLTSIVVTTKNDEDRIGACLTSILEQSYRPLEVIVVDNRSIDRTKEIARTFTDKVYHKGPERSAQRNYGMLGPARGEYVMYVDSDMILAPYLVESCVAFMEENDCVALHIPEIVLGKGYCSRVRRFERRFYEGTVIDGARFFRKDTFADVGGFDTGMSGPEDWDLDKRIKQRGRITLLPARVNIDARKWKMGHFISDNGVRPELFGNVIFHNESHFSLRKYLVKKHYYAGSFNSYVTAWGKTDPDVRKQLGPLYRLFFVFVEDGKWKRLAMYPHLTLGMYLLRILVGITYAVRRLSTAGDHSPSLAQERPGYGG